MSITYDAPMDVEVEKQPVKVMVPSSATHPVFKESFLASRAPEIVKKLRKPKAKTLEEMISWVSKTSGLSIKLVVMLLNSQVVDVDYLMANSLVSAQHLMLSISIPLLNLALDHLMQAVGNEIVGPMIEFISSDTKGKENVCRTLFAVAALYLDGDVTTLTGDMMLNSILKSSVIIASFKNLGERFSKGFPTGDYHYRSSDGLDKTVGNCDKIAESLREDLFKKLVETSNDWTYGIYKYDDKPNPILIELKRLGYDNVDVETEDDDEEEEDDPDLLTKGGKLNFLKLTKKTVDTRIMVDGKEIKLSYKEYLEFLYQDVLESSRFLKFAGFDPELIRTQYFGKFGTSHKLINQVITAYLYLGNNYEDRAVKTQDPKKTQAIVTLLTQKKVAINKDSMTEGSVLTLARIAGSFPMLLLKIRQYLNTKGSLPPTGIESTTNIIYQDLALSSMSGVIDNKDYLDKMSENLNGSLMKKLSKKLAEAKTEKQTSQIQNAIEVAKESKERVKMFRQLAIDGFKNDPAKALLKRNPDPLMSNEEAVYLAYGFEIVKTVTTVKTVTAPSATKST